MGWIADWLDTAVAWVLGVVWRGGPGPSGGHGGVGSAGADEVLAHQDVLTEAQLRALVGRCLGARGPRGRLAPARRRVAVVLAARCDLSREHQERLLGIDDAAVTRALWDNTVVPDRLRRHILDGVLPDGRPRRRMPAVVIDAHLAAHARRSGRPWAIRHSHSSRPACRCGWYWLVEDMLGAAETVIGRLRPGQSVGAHGWQWLDVRVVAWMAAQRCDDPQLRRVARTMGGIPGGWPLLVGRGHAKRLARARAQLEAAERPHERCLDEVATELAAEGSRGLEYRRWDALRELAVRRGVPVAPMSRSQLGWFTSMRPGLLGVVQAHQLLGAQWSAREHGGPLCRASLLVELDEAGLRVPAERVAAGAIAEVGVGVASRTVTPAAAVLADQPDGPHAEAFAARLEACLAARLGDLAGGRATLAGLAAGFEGTLAELLEVVERLLDDAPGRAGRTRPA